jgi:hypothetical protein
MPKRATVVPFGQGSINTVISVLRGSGLEARAGVLLFVVVVGSGVMNALEGAVAACVEPLAEL